MNKVFMIEAIKEAKKAAALGEVPVGAIITHAGKIIARAHNQVEERKDATLHAELIAIKKASTALGKWRLTGCQLYVTLEPCPMCAGAIILSRIPEVFFGAKDPRIGALGSTFDISNLGGMPHQFTAIGGLLGQESSAILKEFFALQRI